ncbi:unnamed protein product, partial [Prorocentrum cordatum]
VSGALFEGVPDDVLEGPGVNILASKVLVAADILELEVGALGFAAKHPFRVLEPFNSLVVILFDNLPLALAACKAASRRQARGRARIMSKTGKLKRVAAASRISAQRGAAGNLGKPGGDAERG